MKISELVEQIEKFKEADLNTLRDLVMNASQIIMIGNGGSNSICSHISQDYTKQLGKKAFTFSDPSRLTCYINDYGIEDAYSHFIAEFADDNTLVILISSSGNSPNIVNSVRTCVGNNIRFITLTGFDSDNQVRRVGREHTLLDVWVDSHDYGVVECAHQVFLHTIVGD